MSNILNRFTLGLRGAPRRRPALSGKHRVYLALEPLEKRDVPAGPILTPPIYQNPFMAPNNTNEIHLNGQQTDTVSVAGPASAASQYVQQSLLPPVPFQSGTMAITTSGQIVLIRVGPSFGSDATGNTVTMLLLDPITLTPVAQYSLPSQSSALFHGFGGGGYFYLNNLDQVVVPTTTQLLDVFSTQNNQFTLVSSYNVGPAINNPDDVINSVLPDSSGNLWFMTGSGVVGFVNTATTPATIVTTTLPDIPGSSPPTPETISKSLATDGNGGVYIVSDYAMYRFHAGPGNTIVQDWRTPYDRGTVQKPGQNQIGSGTTPTVFTDSFGHEWVTIADNASPLMHVNVYNANTGALFAQQAVFSSLPNLSSCENSLIAVNDNIIIENNYGNVTYQSTLYSQTTEPGVDRVAFDPTTGTSSVVWENSTVAIPSIVTQLSTADGLIYTYAKNATGWYFAALDFNTGAVVAQTPVPWSNVAGGAIANNFYSGLMIGPNGTAYVPTLGGLVAWRPQTVNYYAVGTDAGPTAEVKVYNAANNQLVYDLMPYGSFTGGVRVAIGDVNGDGTPDIITGPGPGGGPQINVYDGKTGNLLRSFFAYNASFAGGVYVAAGDFTGGGYDDVAVGPDSGGGPNVVAFDGKAISNGQAINPVVNFFAFNPAFSGGVRVAAGDVAGNGYDDLVVGAGPGAGPNVSVYDLGLSSLMPSPSPTMLGSFFPYAMGFTGGVYVAAGPLSNTGADAVVTGAGAGGGPNVTAYSFANGAFNALLSFFAYNPAFTGGVRVGTVQQGALGNIDNIITAAGPGGGPNVILFNGQNGQIVDQFFAFTNPLFNAGLFVGGS
jgi:hypothetical protein